jgi:hypothetical protein
MTGGRVSKRNNEKKKDTHHHYPSLESPLTRVPLRQVDSKFIINVYGFRNSVRFGIMNILVSKLFSPSNSSFPRM